MEDSKDNTPHPCASSMPVRRAIPYSPSLIASRRRSAEGICGELKQLLLRQQALNPIAESWRESYLLNAAFPRKYIRECILGHKGRLGAPEATLVFTTLSAGSTFCAFRRSATFAMRFGDKEERVFNSATCSRGS